MAKRRDDWLAKAAEAWPRLVNLAATESLESYRQFGDAIGLHWRAVKHALSPIQDYCLEARLPPITSLVVQSGKDTPGVGSVVSGRSDIREIRDEIFRFPWVAHLNPFARLLPGDTLENLTQKLIADPANGAVVYAKVPSRGIAQRVFRTALLQVYNEKCAMCGLTFTEALEAAHIIRWSAATHAQRMDTRNGLLLCATHHKLFDAAYITVNEEFLIRYCDPTKVEYAPYGDIDSRLSAELHNKRLDLPYDKKHWPDVHLISLRNSQDEWEDQAD